MNDRAINPFDLLVCPSDHHKLQHKNDSLYCDACDTDYKINHGIPIFFFIPEWENLYQVDTNYYASDEPFSVEGDTSYLDLNDVNEKGTILDLGAGDGVYSSVAPPDSLVYCVDVTPTGLQRIFKRSMPNLIPVSASGYHLPFDDDVFDTILYIFVVEHLPQGDDLKMLREARRVLKPGTGRLIYTTDTPFFDRHLVKWTNLILRGKRTSQDHTSSTGHINLMTITQSKELVAKAGFEIVVEKRFWMGQRYALWKLLCICLDRLLPGTLAEDFLTSKYTFVLRKLNAYF